MPKFKVVVRRIGLSRMFYGTVYYGGKASFCTIPLPHATVAYRVALGIHLAGG